LEGVVRNLENISSESDTVAIVLKSDFERIVFSTRPQEQMEISIHFKKGFSNKGFIGLIPFPSLIIVLIK
jgi:hypothetical protein